MAKKLYDKSIFIFRRDLRLDDNVGLLEALKNSNTVLPIFIFTKEQIVNNSYKSDHCVKFMIESLKDLDKELHKVKTKLYYFFGDNSTIVSKLIKKNGINAVYVNMDYTPYSKDRDNKLAALCKKNNVDFNSYEDVLLNPVNTILNSQNEVFVKFTPYFNRAKKIKVEEPEPNKYKNYAKIKIDTYDKDLEKFYGKNTTTIIKGGRIEGLKILKNIKKFKDYNKLRNDLSYNTTNLSAYLKFGCISIREAYYAIKNELGLKNDLIKQLYWRDFYYNIAFAHPHVFKGPLKEKYDKIKWDNNNKKLEAWKNGKTGFPIIDAAMTEMNKTGFMHNRARLIVASFLVKILLINWQHGEKYFAQKLIDYDPCVNNGNWQWVAGSGADAQPYFRIFNPWSQAKNHDPDCKYIKKWLPSLKNVLNKHILEWDTYYYDVYMKPIVDYTEQKEKALTAYKKIF